MEEKLVIILNEMAEYLSIAQMKKLQEVLLKNLAENEPQKAEISNAEYLQMFLDAKKIEGCSERTLQYYRVTVERMLQSITTPIRKICTEEIRSYLSGYQQINGCGKVTVDNIRRNISSFFSWLEEEDYIPIVKVRYDTNFDDAILSEDWNESELENDDLKNYKAKAEFYVRQHTDNAVIAKLKGNIPLNSDDVKALEEILWNEVGTKQDYEAEYGQKPLGEFVREIVGLDMNAAKEAFAQYLNDASLDSRQIYFVNQIVEYIVHNGMMKDLSVLQEAPFTDHGSIVEVFTDLSVWMGIRQAIERVNANAVAA